MLRKRARCPSGGEKERGEALHSAKESLKKTFSTCLPRSRIAYKEAPRLQERTEVINLDSNEDVLIHQELRWLRRQTAQHFANNFGNPSPRQTHYLAST